MRLTDAHVNVAFVVLSFSSWLCVSFIPQGVTDFYTCAEDIKQGGEFLLFRMNNIDKTSEHVANQVMYLPMSSKFILLQNKVWQMFTVWKQINHRVSVDSSGLTLKSSFIVTESMCTRYKHLFNFNVMLRYQKRKEKSCIFRSSLVNLCKVSVTDQVWVSLQSNHK